MLQTVMVNDHRDALPNNSNTSDGTAAPKETTEGDCFVLSYAVPSMPQVRKSHLKAALGHKTRSLCTTQHKGCARHGQLYAVLVKGSSCVSSCKEGREQAGFLGAVA